MVYCICLSLCAGVREVVVCKDAKGKVGVSLFAESKGVFVCYVKSGSPGAMAGLRFGDQILQVRGLSLSAVRNHLDKCLVGY